MNTFMQKLGVLAAMLSASLSASAYDFETDGIYYNITDPTAKEVEVTSGSYSGDIVLPSSVSYNGEQYSVTTIEGEAFRGCSSLTSITLPNSVTTIGSGAFWGCVSLTSITLPNSVTTIGGSAFWNCSSLTSITIPNSVTTISDAPFPCCRSLTSIDVDADNQTYSSKDGILYDKLQTTLICCPGGKSEEVIIPNSVTSIGNNAFAGCSSLSSITIPNSVTSIGIGAFRDCRSLTSITIPNSVTSIGERAFSGCRSLTSITIPNSVISIGYDAFTECISLTSIDVDVDNPTYLSIDGILYDKIHNALMRCPAKKSGRVEIPNFVTTIEINAFECCFDMTSITLPSSVTAISEYAFIACGGLTSFTSLAVIPPRCDHPFDGINKQNCTLYVPAESIEAYKQAPEWKNFMHIEAVEAGIDSVVAGSIDGATEVFNLTGAKVADTLENLPAGIYLVRRGSAVRKIAVR